MTPTPAPALALSSPDALVSALPFLLGFTPADSAVVLWLRGRQLLLTQRLDLPAGSDEATAWLAAVWSHVVARDADEIVIVVVTARPDADHLATLLNAFAGDNGVRVRDCLIVDDGRWRSLLCREAECCAPEGRVVDPAIAAHVAAEFAGAGVSPVPARDDLLRELDTDPRRAGRIAVLLADSSVPTGRARDQSRDAVIEAFCHTMQSSLEGVVDEDLTSTAALLSGLDDVRVRDTVLWEVSHADPPQQVRALQVLAAATRCAPEGAVAPVATCTAIAAWLVGDGARAQAALDRALAERPDYSLALLVRHSVRIGLSPAAWREAMAGLTRRQCRHGDGVPRSRRKAS